MIKWGDIDIPKFKNKIFDFNKSCVGIDTETLVSGDTFLWCDSLGNSLCFPSYSEVLTFLTNNSYQNKHCLFWNIKFDFDGLLRILPLSAQKEFLEFGECDVEGYNIRIIGKKSFQIRKGKKSFSFCDASPFFNHMPLDSAGKKYLGVGKNLEELGITRHNIEESYAKDHMVEYIRYCINDAVMTERLGQRFLDNLKRLQVMPKNMISPAGMAEVYVRKNVQYPSIQFFTGKYERLLKHAYESYYGGRFELLKKGYFDKKMFVNDINSAYPFAMTQLQDPTVGEWKKVDRPHRDRPYQFIRGTFFIVQDTISPFPNRLKNGLIVFPNGRIESTVTGEEFWFALDNNLIRHYEIKECWEFTPSRAVFPLQSMMERLYNYRKQLKAEGDELEQVVKIIINSTYGKMLQKVKKGNRYKAGRLFNPVMGSYVTAKCRVQLLEQALKRQDDIVGFATDSIFSTKKLPGIPVNNRLGGWDEDKYKEALMIMSGVYSLKHKNPQKNKNAVRGFTKKGVDWFEILKKNTKTSISMGRERPLHFNECMRIKAYSPKQVNQWTYVPKEIDINGDLKRVWQKSWETCEEVWQGSQESTPLPLDFLKI